MNSHHPHIGHDLATLIARQPAALVAAQELTTIRSEHQTRASFRLAFEDDRVLKGRRFRNRERARTAACLMPLLVNLPLNAVLDSHGDSWLEQWIPGTALGTADTTDDLCSWAGNLLGRIHTLRVDSIDTLPEVSGVHDALDMLASNLDQLADGGAISRETRDRLQALAAAEQPRNPDTGLIHTDFAVENFVVDERGQRYVIDNEHIALGALDYDLVRTFCRWPMTPGQREVFCQAYSTHREASPALAHRVFWSIISLAQSARVRRLHHQPCQTLLRALESLAAGRREEPWPTTPASAAQTA